MTPESLVNDLRETVYSLDLTDETRPRIVALIEEANALHDEYELIREKISSHLRTDPQFRAYQAYHSNKLELQGPDLVTTEEIINLYQNQGEPDDLRTFSFLHAIASDTHIYEVLGQHQGNILVERISGDFSKDLSFRTTDLRQLNKFLIQDKYFAGNYRTDDFVNIGQFFDDKDDLWFSRTPTHQVEVHWNEIDDEMTRLCEFISRTHECPLLASAVGHAWFTRVHPFYDGNGRTARLIANLILIRNQWPPLTITKSNRDEYLDALRVSDIGGDISLLFELFVKSMRQGLQEMGDDRYWRRRYKLELSQKPLQRCNEWTDMARNFVLQFRRLIADHGWSLERISMPDSTTFELLEDGNPNASTMFGILRHPDQRSIKMHLGYMSRELRDANFQTSSDGVHFPPTIYMRERNFFPGAEYYFVHRRDSKILFKEFTFISGTKPGKEVIALYGKTTTLQMSIKDVCSQFLNAIEDLNFPGFDPTQVSYPGLESVTDQIDLMILNGREITHEVVVRLILEALSSGRIQSDQLFKSGMFMTEIGKYLTFITRSSGRVARLNQPLPTLIYWILSENPKLALSIVYLSHEQSVPVVVATSAVRDRSLWKPL